MFFILFYLSPLLGILFVFNYTLAKYVPKYVKMGKFLFIIKNK
tara:strand:- start:881 stop:1009 length:129 start_codon:yes stop_codon:yes gene_type:complete